MDAPEPTAGHPTRTPRPDSRPGWTLAWPAGRRERTPWRTPTAADRTADTFLWSSSATRRDPRRRGDRSGRSTCPGWTLVDGDRGHRTRSDAGHRRRQRVATVARDRTVRVWCEVCCCLLSYGL